MILVVYIGIKTLRSIFRPLMYILYRYDKTCTAVVLCNKVRVPVYMPYTARLLSYCSIARLTSAAAGTAHAQLLLSMLSASTPLCRRNQPPPEPSPH